MIKYKSGFSSNAEILAPLALNSSEHYHNNLCLFSKFSLLVNKWSYLLYQCGINRLNKNYYLMSYTTRKDSKVKF